jgi:hypothetical protein
MNNIQQNIKLVNEIFKKYNIEYMFIGRGAAIIQGFPDTTQDIDVYVINKNNERIVQALKELHFNITEKKEQEILSGKGFIQFLQPFEFDILFYPDGFNSYEDAKKHKIYVQNLPVMNIDGIIKSKKSAGRLKDKETLPRLISFKQYLDTK